MCEMSGTKWLFAVSAFMLVAVFAFAILTGFAPYGSPGEVLQTFYSACNNRNYSMAEKLLVPEATRAMTHHRGVDEGLPGICEAETMQGRLEKVEILHQEVRGEIARIRYRLYFADGSALEETQGLVVQHWAWRIAP